MNFFIKDNCVLTSVTIAFDYVYSLMTTIFNIATVREMMQTNGGAVSKSRINYQKVPKQTFIKTQKKYLNLFLCHLTFESVGVAN